MGSECYASACGDFFWSVGNVSEVDKGGGCPTS